MKTKKTALFLSFLLIFASCQSKHSKTPQNCLKVNLGDEPQTLDPRKVRDLNGLTLMRMFFEGLTRIGPSNIPELALAHGVEISEDLKTYTFYLREATWSNGDPVEAEDFIYAWQTSLDPGFRADNAFQLYPIKNAKKIKAGEMPQDALGVRAIDSTTLVVELEYPLPYFLELAASPILFPVNRHVDRKDSRWVEKITGFVCNGPFRPLEWKHHYLIRAGKNDSYWEAGQVKLDQIEMIMVPELTELELFETKKLHWAGSPLSLLPLDAVQSLKKKGMVHRHAILRTTRLLRIEIRLEGIERKVFFDRLSHSDYEMVYRDWIADYNDPINFLEIFKYKQQSTNNSGWEDPTYSQLLDDSYQCGDIQMRKELLGQCEKILLDAMPIIPLLHHNMLYIKDERLEGVFLSSLGHLDFKWAYWKNAQ